MGRVKIRWWKSCTKGRKNEIGVGIVEPTWVLDFYFVSMEYNLVSSTNDHCSVDHVEVLVDLIILN